MSHMIFTSEYCIIFATFKQWFLDSISFYYTWFNVWNFFSHTCFQKNDMQRHLGHFFSKKKNFVISSIASSDPQTSPPQPPKLPDLPDFSALTLRPDWVSNPQPSANWTGALDRSATVTVIKIADIYLIYFSIVIILIIRKLCLIIIFPYDILSDN